MSDRQLPPPFFYKIWAELTINAQGDTIPLMFCYIFYFSDSIVDGALAKFKRD